MYEGKGTQNEKEKKKKKLISVAIVLLKHAAVVWKTSSFLSFMMINNAIIIECMKG